MIEIRAYDATMIAHHLAKMWDDARTATAWCDVAKRTRRPTAKAVALERAHGANGNAVSRAWDLERMIRGAFYAGNASHVAR